MLAYITLGTNDTEKAVAFYDAVMAEVGAKRVFDNGRLYFYSSGQGQPMFAIGSPYDEQTASNGNGVMPAIACPDRETVDRAYKKAIEAGGTDEGEPGERIPNVFYGAYVRDLDGNKICFCKTGG